MTVRATLLILALALLTGGALPAGVAQRKSAGQPPAEDSRQLAAGAAATDAARRTSDWPLHRGSNYDAHSSETGLLDAFPPAGPAVEWTRPLGAGYSGFTGAEGRVYTQYQTLGEQYVICLDAKSGETIWQYRYAAPYDSAGMYPGPRATPSLAGGCVFFSSPEGLVGCLDSRSGHLIWSLNIFQQFGVEPVEFGYSCAPSPSDGMLLLPVGRPNASMVALDAATGRTLWRSGGDPASHVPALPIELEGRKLVIGYLRNALAAFDLQTGDVVWRLGLSQGYDEHAAWPIYREPYLWIAAPFQAGSELLELSAAAPQVRSLWKSKLMSNDVCSSVLVDGFVYGFDIRDVQSKPHRPSRGQFRCIEFLTGRERWANGPANRMEHADSPPSDMPPELPIGQATVLYADGKLILFNDLGELILARANPDRYEELARSRVLGGELCWTQPMLLDGRLYVRNHSRAACLVLRDPHDETEQAPRLTLADIPQTTYRDWAAWILAVEPEYAMDLPTVAQLKHWYVDCLGLLLVAAVFSALASLGIGRCRRVWPSLSLPEQSAASAIDVLAAPASESAASRDGNLLCGRIQVAVAFLLGALGTTLLSAWSKQFVFTWPLSLFVAFQATTYALGKRPAGSLVAGLLRRLPLLSFLLICLGYFFLCRRLSLAPQWVFLSGFWAAVPFLLWARRQSRCPRFAAVGELILLLVAFTAYYWGSVGVLAWRYG